MGPITPMAELQLDEPSVTGRLVIASVEGWVGAAMTESERVAQEAVHAGAKWSAWRPFLTASAEAPRLPGVYLLREPRTGTIRYVGMAGERVGGGVAQGLRGRLAVNRTGKGAVSGFGEAALDRALADPDWLQEQIEHLKRHGPRRAKEWAAAAISRLELEVSWASTDARRAALNLEDEVVRLLRPHGLWNR